MALSTCSVEHLRWCFISCTTRKNRQRKKNPEKIRSPHDTRVLTGSAQTFQHFTNLVCKKCRHILRMTGGSENESPNCSPYTAAPSQKPWTNHPPQWRLLDFRPSDSRRHASQNTSVHSSSFFQCSMTSNRFNYSMFPTTDVATTSTASRKSACHLQHSSDSAVTYSFHLLHTAPSCEAASSTTLKKKDDDTSSTNLES